MGSPETPWQEVIFENAELLRIIKSFLYWSCRPQSCLTCCWEELNAAHGIARFLLTCRFLSNCNLFADGPQWHCALGRVWVAPERGGALARLSFLRAVNRGNHHRMQQAVRWREAEAERERERRGIRATPFLRRHVLLTTRAAHIVDVFLCDHHNARPLTTLGVPLSMQLNGDLLPR